MVILNLRNALVDIVQPGTLDGPRDCKHDVSNKLQLLYGILIFITSACHPDLFIYLKSFDLFMVSMIGSEKR